MIFQLFIGASLIAVTVVLQVLFISIAISKLNEHEAWLNTAPRIGKTIVALVAVIFWLIFAITLSVWLWSHVFIYIGAFNELEPALYFSTVTFTTLGYGDMVLDEQWRLLSSLTAVNGLMVFGLSTAFLVEFIRALTQKQGYR